MTIYNFAAGPAILAPEVKEAIAAMVLNWSDGLSLAEYPHRSKRFEALMAEAKALVLKHLDVTAEDFDVLFLMGGARQQFDMVARNFLRTRALYCVTGAWSAMASEAAGLFGEVEILDARVGKLPEKLSGSDFDYAYLCSNETIDGVAFQRWPETDVPLVVDASSDIFSRPVDMSHVGLLFAGAQKNAGIAGATIVVVRKSFLEKARTAPKDHLLSYKDHARAHSMLVTPPTLAIGAIVAVQKWLEAEGGVEAMAQRNAQKAAMIYKTIDESGGFYRARVNGQGRSLMDVVFDLPSAELLERFLNEASQAGLLYLKGHRSVGGVRVSLYNAMPVAGAVALAQFMKAFQQKEH